MSNSISVSCLYRQNAQTHAEGVVTMFFIHGENRNQFILLPECVDDFIDENNPARVIDAYINSLDLEGLGFDRTQPNETGRPPYNPKDLLKLYVYGYMNRIRSSRRLETETKRNLEVIWLLQKLSPDHKTIATFRRDNADALKNVFRDFVKLCMRLGLYGKELVALDGSKFKAVNSKDRNFTEKKLVERIARIDENINKYMRELEETDSQEKMTASEKTAEEIADIINDLEERKELYQSYADELARTGESQISLTDPDSRLMKANGKMDVCYNVQSVVDNKNKLIAEFEVTNKVGDVNLITPMAEKTKEMLETETIAVVADKGYDSVQDILAGMNQGVDVHVAGTDFNVCIPANEGEEKEIHSHKDGRGVYLADRNVVLCPMGEVLYPGHYKKEKGQAVFRNSKACKGCTCKCTKEMRGRNFEVPMEASDFSRVYDDANLFVKQIRILGNQEIVKERKSIVEHPFGTIKRNMDAGYCLTKGLQKVAGEFSLIFLAYNLKRVINILGSKQLMDCIR